MRSSLLFFLQVLLATGICSQSLAQTSSTAITDFGNASGDGIVTINFDDSATPKSTVSGSFLHGGVYDQKLINVTLTDGGVYSFGSSNALNEVDAKLEAYKSAHLIVTSNLNTTTLAANPAGYAPGFYDYHGGLTTSGKIILNDGGDKNAIFIFKVSNNLLIPSGSSIVMSSGGPGKNVFWYVQTNATVNGNAVGNFLVSTNLTIGSNITITGKLLCQTKLTLGGGDMINIPTDTDKDGVFDNMDDYPLDPTLAFNNFIGTSTLAFEDLWPNKGDYDMNDLVISYNYKIITNAANIVAQVTANYNLMAAGGVQANGFAIQFPIAASSVGITESGTLESGQQNAVFKLFSDMHTELSSWNTIPGQMVAVPHAYTVNFKVVNGPLISTFGLDGYNPFLVTSKSGKRVEIHLPGKQPTSLASTDFFKTGDDFTTAGSAFTYMTKSRLPWVITVPQSSFGYMIETTDISKGYLHFADWAGSGGTVFTDWYSNLANGYRDATKIFNK